MNTIQPVDHLPLINVALKPLNIIPSMWDDLYQVGYLGLDKACKYFDPKKGFAFSTFAIACIRREVFTEMSKMNRDNYMLRRRSDKLQQDKVLNNDNSYTTVELAELLDTTIQEIDKLSMPTSTFLIDMGIINLIQQGFISHYDNPLKEIAGKLVVQSQVNENVIASFIRTFLQEAVDGHMGEYVRPYLMYKMIGLSFKEIAEIEDCSTETVSHRCIKGGKILRNGLRQTYEEVIGHKPILEIIEDIIEWSGLDPDIEEFLSLSSSKEKLTDNALRGGKKVKEKYCNAFSDLMATLGTTFGKRDLRQLKNNLK